MVRRWSSGAERPDLLDRGIDSRAAWPEYNLHGDVITQYWGRLWEERAEFQLFLHDDDDRVLVEANTVPCPWDGSAERLPGGLDDTLIAAFESADQPGALCALAAVVDPAVRDQGLSAQALLAMRDLAAAHELPSLIAPVRPSWKERYPLTPIEQYATWRRDDGLLLDPWMRVHERLGARQAGACSQSVRITGTVGEWEAWTGLIFPLSGHYVFPGGLSTLDIDRDADLGSYWEPNVWFVHDVEPAQPVRHEAP